MTIDPTYPPEKPSADEFEEIFDLVDQTVGAVPDIEIDAHLNAVLGAVGCSPVPERQEPTRVGQLSNFTLLDLNSSAGIVDVEQRRRAAQAELVRLESEILAARSRVDAELQRFQAATAIAAQADERAAEAQKRAKSAAAGAEAYIDTALDLAQEILGQARHEAEKIRDDAKRQAQEELQNQIGRLLQTGAGAWTTGVRREPDEIAILIVDGPDTASPDFRDLVSGVEVLGSWRIASLDAGTLRNRLDATDHLQGIAYLRDSRGELRPVPVFWRPPLRHQGQSADDFGYVGVTNVQDAGRNPRRKPEKRRSRALERVSRLLEPLRGMTALPAPAVPSPPAALSFPADLSRRPVVVLVFPAHETTWHGTVSLDSSAAVRLDGRAFEHPSSLSRSPLPTDSWDESSTGRPVEPAVEAEEGDAAVHVCVQD